eukprot:4477860-Amphidinium_carterae.1
MQKFGRCCGVVSRKDSILWGVCHCLVSWLIVCLFLPWEVHTEDVKEFLATEGVAHSDAMNQSAFGRIKVAKKQVADSGPPPEVTKEARTAQVMEEVLALSASVLK